MNTVLIIPTGLGAKIGGGCGDALPVAKLIGSMSDKLITHPNVVNGADINEMPNNTLYVEGSQLNRFLNGDINLEEVRSNRILVVVNEPLRPETVNAISASRVTLGAEIKIVVLDTPLKMIAEFDKKTGQAKGRVEGHKELIEQVNKIDDWDALAIASQVDVDKKIVLKYITEGGVNPWGGVEAMASKLIAEGIDKPVAHSPLETEDYEYLWSLKVVVEPHLATEMISMCFLHSVLKGLYKAPKISNKGLSYKDVDVMISPMGCWGIPHRICEKQGIPIIVVKNNTTVLHERMGDSCIYVDNYLEAVGLIQAMKEGIEKEYFFRPIRATKIIKGNYDK